MPSLKRMAREITARNRSMAWLANSLTSFLSNTVVDRTGLEGSYDFQLKWDDAAGGDSEETSALSLFTAVKQQLGLRLEAGRALVEFLVIDRAEHPWEN